MFDRIIRASIRLFIISIMKIDEHQHHLKWLLFRKRCKHHLLCLAHKSIFLGKPDYIYTTSIQLTEMSLHTEADSNIGCNYFGKK